MELTPRQQKILEEAKSKREKNLFLRASKGDKSARHFTEELLGVGDYLESDMDGPRYN